MSSDPELPEPPTSSVPPAGDAVLADQLAAHAAEGRGHHGPFHTHCENCGTRLAGPFCHRCGQHDFEFHRSFWHVFLEVLENFFHFDSKLFRSTVTLLFRPGRLTADFNAGKRVSQMPPFRLYLFVSVLFFFLLFLNSQTPAGLRIGDRVKGDVVSTVNGRPVSAAEALHAATSGVVEEAGDAAAGKPAQGETTADTGQRLSDEVRSAAELAHNAGGQTDLGRRLAELAHRATDPAHRGEMVAHFLHSLPKMLLFCLPLFALYTRILFRKSGQVYLQHLVLALHFHTFIYLWLMFRDGWVFLVGLPGWGVAPYVNGLLKLWMWLYPFLMLRRLFADSWPWTILKTFLLLTAYLTTLGLVMLIGAVVIFTLS
jgi:hypothetical protein